MEGRNAVKRLLLALSCALSLLLPITRTGQAQSHDEHAVKAALVFNLTKYVEWPQGNNEVVIGFVGEGPMGEVLKKMLDGKTSESRPIHVLLSPSDQELEHCHILYIAESSSRQIHAALDRVRDKGILTVGDTEFFVREGGMISLVTVGELVQIQVRLEVAHQSRLKISSRLLNIAVLVPPAPEVKN